MGHFPHARKLLTTVLQGRTVNVWLMKAEFGLNLSNRKEGSYDKGAKGKVN
jgi:hypothetical protein